MLYTAVILFILLLLSGRLIEYQARTLPDYERVDLKEVVDQAAVRAAAARLQEEQQPGLEGDEKSTKPGERGTDFLFTDEEYELLYYQTGLGRSGVNAVLQEDDPETAILQQQENLFKDQDFKCVRDNLITVREQTTDENGKAVRAGEIVALEDGDIIITKSSHTLGWRNGHAALVVDAENQETLEAIILGQNTALRHIRKWEKYPNFLVLRLAGVDASERKQVAKWAKKNLLDIPYRLTAGFFGEKGKGEAIVPVTGTQCAHLIWRAYKEFGYDLDENGGWIVTPRQLAGSPLLEVVQAYGMDLDKLWK